ncbi:hypothetical protein VNO77_01944 [Canavalia gladiata]|uniref:Uncharacterized protein n=1 Tax=Canavalia gladiata TaxID=3824 RepID=A0AAN9R6S2_CANGL
MEDRKESPKDYGLQQAMPHNCALRNIKTGSLGVILALQLLMSFARSAADECYGPVNLAFVIPTVPTLPAEDISSLM